MYLDELNLFMCDEFGVLVATDVYGTSESGGDGDRSDERKERTEIFLWVEK